MEIALLLYDGMAALDAVGPYEVLRNVPGWEVRTVAPEKGEVRDERGTMGLVADKALAEVTAADVLLVPGGRGNRPLIDGRAAARLATRDQRDDEMDDLGLHRLAAARRRRPTGGKAGNDELARARHTARATAPTPSAGASSRTAR